MQFLKKNCSKKEAKILARNLLFPIAREIFCSPLHWCGVGRLLPAALSPQPQPQQDLSSQLIILKGPIRSYRDLVRKMKLSHLPMVFALVFALSTLLEVDGQPPYNPRDFTPVADCNACPVEGAGGISLGKPKPNIFTEEIKIAYGDPCDDYLYETAFFNYLREEDCPMEAVFRFCKNPGQTETDDHSARFLEADNLRNLCVEVRNISSRKPSIKDGAWEIDPYKYDCVNGKCTCGHLMDSRDDYIYNNKDGTLTDIAQFRKGVTSTTATYWVELIRYNIVLGLHQRHELDEAGKKCVSGKLGHCSLSEFKHIRDQRVASTDMVCQKDLTCKRLQPEIQNAKSKEIYGYCIEDQSVATKYSIDRSGRFD